MPTELHDAHQRWVVDAMGAWIFDSHIIRKEFRLLCLGVGTSMFFPLTDPFTFSGSLSTLMEGAVEGSSIC